ncbi:MAG: DUF721 domain-containing protein [Acidobacteria bacterium]|nr:DUF721 domain-containing protein [Acidobacteriota bacterium]
MDRAFDILLSLQRGTPLHGQWVLECLKGSWARLVGAKLAAVCRPAVLKDSVLRIEVVDGSWLDAVRSLQAELQDRISGATRGEVKKLKIS